MTKVPKPNYSSLRSLMFQVWLVDKWCQNFPELARIAESRFYPKKLSQSPSLVMLKLKDFQCGVLSSVLRVLKYR